MALNLQLRTIRILSQLGFPLVRINCRDCDSNPEDCSTCANHGEVLVDEVLESDEALDAAELEAHLSARDAHFAPIRAEYAKRQPWPPRAPTPAEQAELVVMQSDYLRELSMLAPPRKVA